MMPESNPLARAVHVVMSCVYIMWIVRDVGHMHVTLLLYRVWQR